MYRHQGSRQELLPAWCGEGVEQGPNAKEQGKACPGGRAQEGLSLVFRGPREPPRIIFGYGVL